MDSTVKIPDNLFKVTRRLKLQKDVEFYYALKRVDSSGFIFKSDLIERVSRNTTLSIPSIYRRINRLIELTWMKRTSNGYRLCSYRKLFTELEYGDDFNYTLKTLSDKDSVIKVSARIEIERKLKEQSFAAVVALKRDKRYQRSFKKTRGSLFERLDQVVQDQLAYMVETNQRAKLSTEYATQSQSTFKNTSCNPDITLSHHALVKLLGLKSTSQAYVLLKEMEEESLVEIERNRRVLVERDLSYQAFLVNYGDRFYRYSGTNCYKILPNKYFFR